MIGHDRELFRDGSLSDFLEARQQGIESEIYKISGDQLLATSTDDLCDGFLETYRLAAPVLQSPTTILGEQEASIREVRRSGRASVKPTTVTVSIPFEGNAVLFRYTPSSWSDTSPTGHVMEGLLEIGYTCRDTRADPVTKTEIDADVGVIREWLRSVDTQVVAYNDGLPAFIRGGIESRKEKLLRDLEMAEAIGYPINKRDDTPTVCTVRVERKRLPIERQTATSAKSFYRLEEDAYEDILETVSDMAAVIERSPKAFATLGEEDLRHLFLFPLNGLYQGQATGETFNFEGKTDILIRAGGRNIFIAECKFWDGAKVLTGTIDQLLGYAAWRDTKTAIILFNRNKNLSAVLAQIPGIAAKHPNFKRPDNDYNNETRFRFVLHHNDDRNRELCLTILVFEVPTEDQA